MRVFDPQPDAGELPRALPNPFSVDAPHPLAVRAARALQEELLREAAAANLWGPDGGKMFGVLVVADRDGRLGYLCGYSGMLERNWQLEGFAPPLFDLALRDSFWLDGERALGELASELQAARDRLDEALAGRDLLAAEHAAAQANLQLEHTTRRHQRKVERAAAGGLGADALALRLHELAQQSRGDEAERRQQRARHRDALADRQAACDRERAIADEIDGRRAALSRILLHRIRDTYTLRDARGEVASLQTIFGEVEPPGGAGDCAGPKLFGWAYARGLRPLALAEFWWGAEPPNGGRLSGVFYPSCRGKCGPVLGHMLGGLRVADTRLIGETPADPLALELELLYEDEWVLVLDKPAGLLSVPGRHARLKDSVLTRMRERLPEATGPLIVHRLDAEVSGLMVIAKSKAAHKTLQHAFARREVDKRYHAWLEGALAGDEGRIELPLRGDLEDRPRQLVCHQHGKAALTSWQVLEREPDRTLVELRPHTGRTHQLRVHCAHAAGLGHPIIGDRLYGRAGPALLLRAHSLGFAHPVTAAPLHFIARDLPGTGLPGTDGDERG